MPKMDGKMSSSLRHLKKNRFNRAPLSLERNPNRFKKKEKKESFHSSKPSPLTQVKSILSRERKKRMLKASNTSSSSSATSWTINFQKEKIFHKEAVPRKKSQVSHMINQWENGKASSLNKQLGDLSTEKYAAHKMAESDKEDNNESMRDDSKIIVLDEDGNETSDTQDDEESNKDDAEIMIVSERENEMTGIEDADDNENEMSDLLLSDSLISKSNEDAANEDENETFESSESDDEEESDTSLKEEEDDEILMRFFIYSEKECALSEESALMEINDGKIMCSADNDSLNIQIEKITKIIIGIDDETPSELIKTEPHLILAIFVGSNKHYFVQSSDKNSSILFLMEQIEAQLEEMNNEKKLSMDTGQMYSVVQINGSAEIYIIPCKQNTGNDGNSDESISSPKMDQSEEQMSTDDESEQNRQEMISVSEQNEIQTSMITEKSRESDPENATLCGYKPAYNELSNEDVEIQQKYDNLLDESIVDLEKQSEGIEQMKDLQKRYQILQLENSEKGKHIERLEKELNEHLKIDQDIAQRIEKQQNELNEYRLRQDNNERLKKKSSASDMRSTNGSLHVIQEESSSADSELSSSVPSQHDEASKEKDQMIADIKSNEDKSSSSINLGSSNTESSSSLPSEREEALEEKSETPIIKEESEETEMQIEDQSAQQSERKVPNEDECDKSLISESAQKSEATEAESIKYAKYLQMIDELRQKCEHKQSEWKQKNESLQEELEKARDKSNGIDLQKRLDAKEEHIAFLTKSLESMNAEYWKLNEENENCVNKMKEEHKTEMEKLRNENDMELNENKIKMLEYMKTINDLKEREAQQATEIGYEKNKNEAMKRKFEMLKVDCESMRTSPKRVCSQSLSSEICSHIQSEWHSTNVYDPKNNHLHTMTEEQISDSAMIIGKNKQYEKRILANAEFVSIGSQRFYYRDIEALDACRNSNTKWMISTRNCMIRIQSKSKNARDKFMTFIQSILWLQSTSC